MTPPKHTTKDEQEGSDERDGGGGGATADAPGGGAGPALRLAVYGTLRRGGPNHDRYMRGYRSVEEITLRGRLRWLTATIPILEVPNADVAAVGTADPLADMRLAERLQREWDGAPRPAVPGSWDEIPAELFAFDDPASRGASWYSDSWIDTTLGRLVENLDYSLGRWRKLHNAAKATLPYTHGHRAHRARATRDTGPRAG